MKLRRGLNRRGYEIQSLASHSPLQPAPLTKPAPTQRANKNTASSDAMHEAITPPTPGNFIQYSRWAAVQQFVSQPKVDRTNPKHFHGHVYTAAIGVRAGSEGGPEVPYAFCNIFKFIAVF